MTVNGWKLTTVGECCDITSGGTPSKHNPRFWNGSLPFVSARDLKSDWIDTAVLSISPEAVEQSSAKIAPVGSLLMLVRGMGLANGIQIGEVTAPVAFNQDIRAIHPPRDLLVPRFLLLALRHAFCFGTGADALSSAAHGTLKIDTDALKRLPVPLPPLPEQRRIVGILDEAFAAIATAKANTETNLRNARAVFESELDAVFGQPSESWTRKALQEVGTTQTGSTPKTSDADNYGDFIPFVKPADFRTNGTLDYDNDGLSKKGLALARVVRPNSVLMVCIGATIGKCGFCERDITTNQQINAFIPNASVFYKFVYYQMMCQFREPHLRPNDGAGRGGAISSVLAEVCSRLGPRRAEAGFSAGQRAHGSVGVLASHLR